VHAQTEWDQSALDSYWTSIEPSSSDCGRQPEYGRNAESNYSQVYLGQTSAWTFSAALGSTRQQAEWPVHGEASVAYTTSPWQNGVIRSAIVFPRRSALPRKISFVAPAGSASVKKWRIFPALDRPVALEPTRTLGVIVRGTPGRQPVPRLAPPRSKVIESDFTGGKGA